MKKQKPLYQNKRHLLRTYLEQGSTWRAADVYHVSNGTVNNWMRRYHIPRIPRPYLFDNNSGRGRLAEFYVIGHPFFKRHYKDLGVIDDKSKYDGLWYGDRVNIKCSHSQRFSFRIKIKNGRHVATFYICCCYDDNIDPLIPIEIFVIPSKIAPYTTITISNIQNGKYAKYRLSLKRGIEFSTEDEKKYNAEFRKKYSKILKKKKVR